jgi:16S rRNA (guanine966-N2)-methyltransferase
MMQAQSSHQTAMSAARNRKTKPGSVRIIGGSWRRYRIAIPPGDGQRPTPDRVRETLFNWLLPRIEGAECLDLFAGTGVLGFEALSRNAGRAVLVERDQHAVELLKRINEDLDARAEIVCADAKEYLSRPVVRPFDIAFVDPPYAEDVVPTLAGLLPLMKPRACIYLERARGGTWPDLPGATWSRRATAGRVEYGLAELGP